MPKLLSLAAERSLAIRIVTNAFEAEIVFSASVGDRGVVEDLRIEALQYLYKRKYIEQITHVQIDWLEIIKRIWLSF